MSELINLPLFTDANLQGYYRFEGNSNDATANGNNGTDTAMTYGGVYGKYGQGASFNGTTSKITLAGITITGNLTFAGWVNVAAYGIVESMIVGGATNCAEFFIDSNGKLNLAKAGVTTIGTSNTAVGIGSWHHIAVTYDGTTATFYYDGKADGTGSSVQTFSVAVTLIGTDGSFFHNGSMDDLAVFNRVLTATEINSLFLGQGLVVSDI